MRLVTNACGVDRRAWLAVMESNKGVNRRAVGFGVSQNWGARRPGSEGRVSWYTAAPGSRAGTQKRAAAPRQKNGGPAGTGRQWVGKGVLGSKAGYNSCKARAAKEAKQSVQLHAAAGAGVAWLLVRPHAATSLLRGWTFSKPGSGGAPPSEQRGALQRSSTVLREREGARAGRQVGRPRAPHEWLAGRAGRAGSVHCCSGTTAAAPAAAALT